MTGSRAFGSWLRQHRRALDLTQKELAQRAGCSTVTIHKIETGALHPSKDMAERLALCLEISPEARAGFVRFARGGIRPQGLEDGPAGDTSGGRHSYHLPFPATQLIGRDADLAAIRKRLAGGARLLTLTGPPGVGKTRLALEVAHQAAGEYPDGVFFVSLAALTDSARVAKAIGQALNIAEARAWPVIEQLKFQLREKQILLVLDNLEQIIEAAELLAGLLTACPWLAILVTSRQALHIQAERLYVVAPLPVPPLNNTSAHALTAAEALDYPAVALFVERAEAVVPGFPFPDSAAETVAEICRRLDGLPLAIELVAAHVDLFSPAELLQRLTGPWILASTGPRDAPPRQQTLQDAIDWSYELLGENDKVLLRRLAVFAGGANLAAIEAVCECQTENCLASLVEKSLVQRVTAPEAERRFALLEMIRDFALLRLADCGEERDARLRHLRYYRRLAAEGHAGLGGPHQFGWLRRFERERANFHTALAWAFQSDPVVDREAAGLGIRLAANLYGFWWLGSHLREGLSWLERSLDVARRLDEESALPELLWKAGACAGYLGLGRKSASYFDACIDTSRAILGQWAGAGAAPSPTAMGASEAKRALGHALELRSFFKVERCEPWRARADLDEAIAIFREMGDELDLAHALNTYGHWAGRNGQLQVARNALEECLGLVKRAGNLWGTAMVSGDLVRLYEYSGELEKAYEQWTRDNVPPSTMEGLGEVVRIHVVMWWLCYLATGEGDNDRRLGVLRKAFALQDTLGYRSFFGRSLYEPVFLALQAGMPLRAIRLAAATKVWQERLELPFDDPPQLTASLARVKVELGEAAFARVWDEGQAMTIPESAAYALTGEE